MEKKETTINLIDNKDTFSIKINNTPLEDIVEKYEIVKENNRTKLTITIPLFNVNLESHNINYLLK